MSDISLSFTPIELAFFVLATAWPGLVVGVICGALLWRKHRVGGAVLGIPVGLMLGAAAFCVWSESTVSRSVSFWDAEGWAALIGLPGAIVFGVIGGWRLRADRIAGATAGAIIGWAVSLAVYLLFLSEPF